jgi:hypothetical protein
VTASERSDRIDSLLSEARDLHMAGEFLDARERTLEAAFLLDQAEEERKDAATARHAGTHEGEQG